MKTLYLIDGHAQFFRAFHAIRTPMSSPVTKEPTNATFGFVGMLFKLLRELKPDYLVVAIDVSGDKETFRSELYAEYKANRDAPPEALFPQVDRCVALLKEIGVPVLGVAGFEADDVIATLTRRLVGGAAGTSAAGPGVRVRLVSKDKDLQQLLRAGAVEMYDVHTDELLDEARLRAEKGIGPGQVVDMLTLMGDSVDNVPGVEGVGPKTAAELIARYGSLEELVARAPEIPGKRGEKLREAIPRLGLSKTLVTLREDVPLEFELGSAEVARLHLERLEPILRELGFNRYQEELKKLVAGTGAESEGEKGTGSRAGVASRGTSVARDSAAARPRGAGVGAGAGAGAGDFGGLFDGAGGGGVDGGAASEPRMLAGVYHCVRRRTELEALVERCRGAEVVAFDTETTSLSPLRAALCGVSVSIKEGEAFYVPVRSPEAGTHMDTAEVLGLLGPLLEDPRVSKCGHNLKYDALVLRSHGVEVRGGGGAGGEGAGSDGATLFDSMVASYLIDASRSSHSLDALCLALLGHRNIPISDLIGSGKNQRTFDSVELGLATDYAAEDADMSLRLRGVLLPQLRAMGLWELFCGVEMPLVEVLAELEWNGISVDPAELDRQAARLNVRLEEIRRSIAAASPRPFNPDSPKQLAEVLFNKAGDEPPGLGLTPIKKTKTGFSTDVEVLEKLAGDPLVTSPVPGLIVEHRQLGKLVGTYLTALKEEINPRTGRVHASFNQTVAATGRLSSSDPNLQNIPIRTDIGREIRRAFVAEAGNVLISADYSQIELRLLAHLSRDPALIQAFHEGQDIHAAVAAQIHGVAPEQVTREQRGGAKMVNFGIVYGITAFGLARRLGVDNAAAAAIIDSYKKRFAGITTFLEECVAQARGHGYVETILKRRRPVTGIDSRNPSERALAERIAINSVVQGSAADLIKVAMVDLHTRLSDHAGHLRGGAGERKARAGGARGEDARGAGALEVRPEGKPEIPGVRMLLQIHDELVFEAPLERASAAAELVRQRMEGAMTLCVPLKVDVGWSGSWFEEE